MFWKILGIVAALWLAFVVLGAVLKAVMAMVIPLVVLTVLAFGGYLVYKAVSGSKSSGDVTRL